MMTQSAYWLVMQLLAETRAPPYEHIRTTLLGNEAYDYLAFSVAAMNMQHSGILHVATRMFLCVARRDAAREEMIGQRDHRLHDRALQAVPTLRPQDTTVTRVRQLVRAHLVELQTLNALLDQHPELRAAAAMHREQALAEIQEDESSSEEDDDSIFEP